MKKTKYEVKGHRMTGWFELSAVRGIYVAYNEEQAQRFAELYMPPIFEVRRIGDASNDEDLGFVEGSNKIIDETTDLLDRYYDGF